MYSLAARAVAMPVASIYPKHRHLASCFRSLAHSLSLSPSLSLALSLFLFPSFGALASFSYCDYDLIYCCLQIVLAPQFVFAV